MVNFPKFIYFVRRKVLLWRLSGGSKRRGGGGPSPSVFSPVEGGQGRSSTGQGIQKGQGTSSAKGPQVSGTRTQTGR